MSGWQVKRFWTNATVVPVDGGFRVALDKRFVATPAKTALVLPTERMAQAVAAEWNAQEKRIAPETMPVTRSANAAIDKVGPQFEEVADLIAAYGASDLLCYRAPHPEVLAERQALAWDPMLDWAHATYGVRLETGAGVTPIAQPESALARLSQEVRRFTSFELVALHDLVGLSGSLILGLGAAKGAEAPEKIWKISRIDEDWQAEIWGQDDEAAQSAANKRAEFLHAIRFLALCKA
ncbi:MAG: ATPase [Rhodobacteraceae bacterium]|nr:ATPase [Paracoccaceae bacterium]